MALLSLRSSRTILRMALSLASPISMSRSTRFLNSVSASAMAVLSAIMALAQLASAPTARNSNLLPVKAKGDVRLRSVLSMSSSGIDGMSSLMATFPAMLMSSSLVEFSIWSRMDETVFPRKDEMMAGGASLAPSRCALVALMMEALSSPLCLCTALSVSATKVTNLRLSMAFFPGPCSRMPVSVDSDQLLCLPDPLTPLKGFSCRRQRKPCFRAMRRMRIMMSMLWSMARLHSSKMGASSNWLGATSL